MWKLELVSFVTGMVDIHSHVLPGLDDGAHTLEDSVAMLEMAAAAGTSDIVATPHANTEYKYDAAVVEAKLAEVRDAMGSRIRIHSGCDFHLTFDNINDAIANPTKYTIAHRNWLLVEFSDLLIFQNTGDIFHRLREAGMLPVITHPERNQLLQQRMHSLERWVAEGAYVQVTAASLLGLFGATARKFSEKLIERGLVHFVASDAHDTEYRTTKLDGAYEWLTGKYGQEYADQVLITNPKAAIDGSGRLPDQQPPVRKRRRWFALWA